MLAGNVAGLLSPIVLVAIFTLIFGVDKYDWKSMMDIRRGDDHELADAAGLDIEGIPGGHTETSLEFEEEQKKLARAGKISKTTTVVMVSSSFQNKVMWIRLTWFPPAADIGLSGPLAYAHVRLWVHLQQALLHRLGGGGHHVDLLLLPGCRAIPGFREPKDTCPNNPKHLP